MSQVKMPTVLRPEHATVLNGWGVHAPDPAPRFREEDGRFVMVEAPEGWKTDYHPHSMYQVLMDARGFWRACYFAKQAIWDTRISVNSVETAVHTALFHLPSGLWEPRVVLGHRWILWTGTPGTLTEAQERASTYLLATYPEATDFNAYWDLAIPEGAKEHKVQV